MLRFDTEEGGVTMTSAAGIDWNPIFVTRVCQEPWLPVYITEGPVEETERSGSAGEPAVKSSNRTAFD
jgi:hypothetical protein